MTSSTTARSPSRSPLSVWDLPKLATLVHSYRKSQAPAKNIRPHFPAVLAFVHRNRLATCDQVRRRFPQYLPSDRTARRHLAEMESLELLGVQAVTNVSPLMPKPYFVTRSGLKLLRDSFANRGQNWEPSAYDRRRSRGLSFPHVWHELAVTEFLLSVWEAAAGREDLELLLTERRSLVTNGAFELAPGSRPSRLEPDGLFLIRQRERGMMCCLLEIDTGTETERQLGAKLDAYQRWTHSAAARQYLCGLYSRFGAERPRPIFRLLFTMCSAAPAELECRTQAIHRVVGSRSDALKETVWITSADDLRPVATNKSVLDSPLWIRASDEVNSSCEPHRAPLFCSTLGFPQNELAQVGGPPLFPGRKDSVQEASPV